MKHNMPYMNATSYIGAVLDQIKKASVPSKFTYDFLTTKLGIKSSSARAIIPLLKKLELLTQDGVPTEKYKKFRHKINGPKVLAESIKKAYGDIFISNEYAHNLSRQEIEEIVKTISGLESGSKILSATSGTFDELCKLAVFEDITSDEDIETTDETTDESKDKSQGSLAHGKKISLSYTINLNLPPTTDIEVFNAIFKSLKENLLID